MKKPINASLRLERSANAVNQLKGALAVAIEKELGDHYAPMHWVYGPRTEWPITGVCPVVWGYVGVLYTMFPEWLRDELLPYAGRIAKSVADASGRQRRARTLGLYAITESFRLHDLRAIKSEGQGLLKSYETDPSAAYNTYRSLLNSIQAPNVGFPLLSTLGGISNLGDSDNPCQLWSSVLRVGEIPALVAKEASDRNGFLAPWDRAISTLNTILEITT